MPSIQHLGIAWPLREEVIPIRYLEMFIIQRHLAPLLPRNARVHVRLRGRIPPRNDRTAT